MDKIIVRVGGRCKLNVEAAKQYESVKNKSDFIANAINFYIEYGRLIQEQNKKIELQLEQIIERLGIQSIKLKEELQEQEIQSIKPELTEEVLTEEEKERLEKIYFTLNYFLSKN